MGTSRASKNLLMRAAKKVSEKVVNPRATYDGIMADSKRGGVLWKQGYGKKHDSKLKLAWRGKSNPTRH